MLKVFHKSDKEIHLGKEFFSINSAKTTGYPHQKDEPQSLYHIQKLI